MGPQNRIQRLTVVQINVASVVDAGRPSAIGDNVKNLA
jgi:hypothetical protein